MIKRIICIVVLLNIVIYCIYSQITQITSITNEQRINDYDRHVSAVIKYDNKIISQKESSIVEYLILPDGYLEQISYYEIVASTNTAYEDEGRYYSFINDRYRGVKQMLVFDLSQTPMEMIANIDLPLHAESAAFVLFDDEIMMISNNMSHRIEIYDKFTYNHIGSINGYAGSYAAKRGNTIMIPYYHDTGIVMKVLNLSFENEYTLEEVALIYFPNIFQILDMEFQEEKLVISHSSGILIYDISDDFTHTLLYDIPVEQETNNTRRVLYSIYTPQYLYASTLHAALLVFELGDNGQYNKIYDDRRHNQCRFRNMALDYPFLYMNKERMLMVYDISSSEIQEHSYYGKGLTSSVLIPKTNDFFLLHNTHLNNSNITELYNALSDDVLFIKEFAPRSNNWADIKDNRLFLNVTQTIDNVSHRWIEIYLLNSPDFTLLSSTYIGESVGDFVLSDNLIFIRDYSSGNYHVLIYDLVGDELIYNSTILGTIDSYPRNYHNYLYTKHNLSISIKDISHFIQVELLLIDLAGNWSDHYSHDETHLLLTNISNRMFIVYDYNIREQSYSILNHNISGIITTSNGIITKNAWLDLNTSFYYVILDGVLTEIGSKLDPLRWVSRTYFYPEHHTMIQDTQSGYYMYDIDYTVSEADKIIEPFKNVIMYSYPNPFNPSTTIKYALQHASHLRVDIYNIKGQKVRSLLNEHRPAGEHSIVWNGKDDNGNEMGSGIYFYRMEVEGYVETKKMVLMK